MSRREHLENVAANLQLIADLGYGDTALATADERGRLTVIVDARPSTAPAPFKTSRAGAGIAPRDEPEAYEALAAGRPAEAARRRVIGGVTYAVSAYPVGAPEAFAVVLRTYAEQLEAAPSRMERAFVDSARDLLGALRSGPILDVNDGRPFATSRTAGDGLMRVDLRGRVTYASPNAVGIMRLAGVEGRVTGSRAASPARGSASRRCSAPGAPSGPASRWPIVCSAIGPLPSPPARSCSWRTSQRPAAASASSSSRRPPSARSTTA